ncbi:zeta toxin family protein (plasmid) [Streptomyces albidoflavus]|uniref:zeta toxin family protein n=1 Tax=Streptomyces albidoflavus TaxID=1886 RepID=UPI0036D42329
MRLFGDDFKAASPDYFDLLRDDPRGAGAAIRADYRAWFTEAEAYVRARRGDVVIEAAPGSREEFLASARPFAAGGYQVELVVLAVRAPDSRLATALRYARAQRRAPPTGAAATEEKRSRQLTEKVGSPPIQPPAHTPTTPTELTKKISEEGLRPI